jgi:hypothetical protein
MQSNHMERMHMWSSFKILIEDPPAVIQRGPYVLLIDMAAMMVGRQGHRI